MNCRVPLNPFAFLFLICALLVMTGNVWAASYRDISSLQAKELIEKKKNVVLVDVRSPDEFRQARIKGAQLIPVDQFVRRVGEIPRNRPVLIYCAVGSRSRMAAEYLSRVGHGEVYNMSDGIVGWYRNRQPIQQ